VETLASTSVEMQRLDTEAVRLPNAELLQLLCEIESGEITELLQLLCEIESGEITELLPPALHPTIPGIVSWQVMNCPESPWGPFRMALTRIECRSGVRPRAFTLSGRVDNQAALQALREGWGYPLQLAEIEFRRSYDSTSASVIEDDLSILEIALRDPEPLGNADVQYVSDVHLAHTPRGIRLVQVDPSITVKRAERGTPEVTSFEGIDWGDERVVPNYPVSASVVVADITLEKLRFLCLPHQLAFTGTETV
jgi:hypothetical protein